MDIDIDIDIDVDIDIDIDIDIDMQQQYIQCPWSTSINPVRAIVYAPQAYVKKKHHKQSHRSPYHLLDPRGWLFEP